MIIMARQSVKEFFNSYAVDFDNIYEGRQSLLEKISSRFLRKSIKRRFLKTIQECSPVEGKTILDIGCGSGQYATSLAVAGAKYVLGIDFSRKMIELAQKRTEQLNVQDRCRFVAADFMDYDFSKSFDYSIAIGFMEYVSEPNQAVVKIVKLTKNKALFSFPDSRGILAWQRRFRYRWKCPLFMYSRREIVNLFGEISCRDIAIEKINRDYYVTVTM